MAGSEKHGRLAVFQKSLKTGAIAAAFLSFSRDVFYFTGTAQPCILVVTQDNYRLFVKRAYDFVMDETHVPPENIQASGSVAQALAWLESMGVTKGALGLAMDATPANAYRKLTNACKNFSLTDITALIMRQRAQKDEEEIAAIREACRIMDQGHKRLLETLRVGMSEREAAAEVEYGHRTAGHEGVLSMRNLDFYISRGPVASGENLLKVSGFSNTITGVGMSAAIPAGPSDRILRKGDLLIVDIPTCRFGYHCDQTRTYSLGRPLEETAALFRKLRAISDTTIQSLRAGVTCRAVFEVALATAEALGVGAYFLGLPPRKGNFIGHGIGLDANEPPILFDHSQVEIRENYVLTVELHLAHPQIGAVKLEDVVLVHNEHAELLTITPRELFVVDA